ncbi:SRPBCC family protein [[Mycobacterium] crassicus]|uniref:SRPBCC domain-containing protein n=1 Tax=[Mycobacterium] crassicus TaxID=2872309 RepID=A0ABU5XJ08_9MYCO|nr:SRPBCC domain-containing protein [Mycolicibacter sp. MYC098]MEB3021918.1 SRPBCC domain-containing protein [Mycolicibacter sp. MYC098]
MTYARTGAISVDQFIDAPPAKVWRALTEPGLHEKWWAPGDIAETVGHEFHLQMPGFGSIPCRVVESVPHERFVYTFNDAWTLTWRLVPEGRGTRLLLEHSGFDLDDKRDRDACERMGPGWRDGVLPRLAELVPQID